MKKIFIFLIGLLFGIIIFMPKDNLYYTFQAFLKKNNIYINSDIKSGLYLKLNNGIIYYKKMDIAKFQNISFLPLIFFNELNGKNITLSIGNYKITSLKAIYSIISPIKIFIKGESNFGKIEGNINLVKKELKIYIQNLTSNSLKKFLKKDNKGYFYYAKF